MVQSAAAKLESEYALRNLRAEWTPTANKQALIGGDLKRISRGGLPWKVKDAHNVQLGMDMFVQVEDVIDISQSNPRPGFGQSNSNRNGNGNGNTNNHNRGNSTASNRNSTLQVVFTDGGQEFCAITTVPFFTGVYGSKCVLRRHALIRRGRVILAPNCVQLIGTPSVPWKVDADRVIRALKACGLPLPSASTFDSIAAQGPIAPMGLAHPSIIGEADNTQDGGGNDGNDDEEDADFWAAAAQMADEHVLSVTGNT